MIPNFGCRRLVLRVSIPASLTTQRKTEAAPGDVQRPCPVCGRSHFTLHWLKGELRIVRCRACEMVFANPAPAGMASGRFYDTEGAAYYLSPAKLESDYADVRFERELKLFRKFCPRGAVLDVGCSSGAFLFQLHKRWPGDFRILGTDVSGAPLDYAESRGVPVARGNFLELDFSNIRTRVPHPDPLPIGPEENFPKNSRIEALNLTTPLPSLSSPSKEEERVAAGRERSGPGSVYEEGVRRTGEGLIGGVPFDAVTFWAVLEHLAEPKRYLEKAQAVLKPGGLCFVLVPNLESLAVRLLGARYRYIYPQHLNYFTAQTLRRLMEPHFSVVEFRTTHFNPIILWQDFRHQGREVSNAERAELLKRTTGYKQSAAMKPVRALYQATEKLLGPLRLADNLVAVLQKR